MSSRGALPYFLVVAASLLFRLPALLNADATNSDAAVVGLQAMHILRGEWSPFLFGSGYQTSSDSAMAALFFAFLGPTPLALMLSSLVGHIALTTFVFLTLRRHVDRWMAATLTLPLVFTGSTIHGNALYPPRQMSLTMVFFAIWIVDGAFRGSRPKLRLAIGTAAYSLACFADPYALLFAPLVGLYVLLVVHHKAENKRERLMSVGTGAVGAALGAVPFALLRAHPRALGGATKLTTDVFAHNYRILVDTSLPWAFGTTPYIPARMMDYGPWHAAPAFHSIQVLGAVVLVIGILFGGIAFLSKCIPAGIRSLGLVGFASLPVSVGAFLTSMMVMDHFSTRYLVAFLLMVPFSLAPAAWMLKSRRFLVLLLPSLVSAAVAGWVGYGPSVDGMRIRGNLSVDDYRLGEVLRAHHITCAVADYWVAYRLTFLYKEEIVVIPSHALQDRYSPYRRICDGAPAYAYLFDPLRTEEPLASVEARLASSGVTFERLDVGTRTALLVRR